MTVQASVLVVEVDLGGAMAHDLCAAAPEIRQPVLGRTCPSCVSNALFRTGLPLSGHLAPTSSSVDSVAD